jgi:hypothetical protein
MKDNDFSVVSMDGVYYLFKAMDEFNQLFGQHEIISAKNLMFLITISGFDPDDISKLKPISSSFASDLRSYEKLDSKRYRVLQEYSRQIVHPIKATKSKTNVPSRKTKFAPSDYRYIRKKTKTHIEVRHNIEEPNTFCKPVYKAQSKANTGVLDVSMSFVLLEYLNCECHDCILTSVAASILKKAFGADLDISNFYFRAYNLTSCELVSKKQIEDFLSSSEKSDLACFHIKPTGKPKSFRDAIISVLSFALKMQLVGMPFFLLQYYCEKSYGDRSYATRITEVIYPNTAADVILTSDMQRYLDESAEREIEDEKNDIYLMQKYKEGVWPWIKPDERGPIDPREIVGGLKQVLIKFDGKDKLSLIDCLHFVSEHYPFSNSFRQYFSDIVGECQMGFVSIQNLRTAKDFYEVDYFNIVKFK